LDLVSLARESGLRCSRCGDGRCARPQGIRFRKRVVDLSTGKVFERLPIRRIIFCDGTTGSLVPAEIWRGRFTISSVVEAVARVHRDGIEGASEWALYGGTGEEMVSESTLRRWRGLVDKRLIGSAWSQIGPRVGLQWSGSVEVAIQIEALLEKLSGDLLLGFRALTGRSVLDKAPPCRPPTRSTARRLLEFRSSPPPHETPSSRRPRGSWSRRTSRGPPPVQLKEEKSE